MQAPVVDTANQMQQRWLDVINYSPLYILKMEFRLEEIIIIKYITEINKELSSQQAALDKGEDISQLMDRSQQFSKDGKIFKGGI